MELNATMRLSAQDALLGLLAPIWQITIAACLLVVTVIAAHKLVMRGPSQMSRGVMMAGGAILGVIAIGVLFSIA